MSLTSIVFSILLFVSSVHLSLQSFQTLKLANSGLNKDFIASYTFDDLKDTNRTERDLLICDSGKNGQILKLEIETDSSEYPRLCDTNRTLQQFRISVNITVRGKRWPVSTILNVHYFQETRVNGSAKVKGIGYVESGAEPLLETSFYVVYDVPNLNPFSCFSIEGLTRQSGVGEIIFANIDNRRLNSLIDKYTNDQLVAMFRRYNVADCIGSTVLSYTPGLINEHILDEYYPISNTLKRDTTETIGQFLDECEALPSNVVRIEETARYQTLDSCDAIDLFDRYENDINEFAVYIGNNANPNRTQAKILYSNGFRNKGSFYGIAIGIIIKGPLGLLGDAYLEILDLPNFNPYACDSEPGVTQLVGSTEKIIANLDVQNLLSIMDLDSIVTKIRSNRLVDCLGGATVLYSPGLVSSDVQSGEIHAAVKPQETTSKPKLKNYFKYDNKRKIFVDKLG